MIESIYIICAFLLFVSLIFMKRNNWVFKNSLTMINIIFEYLKNNPEERSLSSRYYQCVPEYSKALYSFKRDFNSFISDKELWEKVVVWWRENKND